MGEDSIVYVGVDVSKNKHAIAVAEGGRTGEVRYFGEIETTPASVEAPRAQAGEEVRAPAPSATKRARRGYGLHRQITAMGHVCEVVAPSLIPKRAGERVKTDRRDAVTLARLLRAGELTGHLGARRRARGDARSRARP